MSASQINSIEVIIKTDGDQVINSILGIPGPAATSIVGPPGPQGLPGAASASYSFEQDAPSMVWMIDHNLGFYPDVIVYDPAGNEIEGQITNPTINRTTIVFSKAIAGLARLS